MVEIIIKEDESVGFVKFGMSMAEAENCINIYKNNCNSMIAPVICEYDDDGKVNSIHLLIEAIKEDFHCTFKGIDVLNTKASKLIEHFDHLSPYIRNLDTSIGYTYEFPTLGLSFWRGNVCTEEDLEADWFKELIPEIQEDNKKFLYFETVTFKRSK